MFWIFFNAICTDTRELLGNKRGYTNLNSVINIISCYFFRQYVYVGESGSFLGEKSPNGGIVYLDMEYFCFKVKNSIFDHIKCGGIGGCIYAKGNSTSESGLSNVCANHCSGIYCHFSYINSCYRSVLDLQSIMGCSKSIYDGSCTIWLINGEQELKSSNISNNNAKHTSGINCQSEKALNLQNCYFTNNNAESRCVFLRDHGYSGSSYKNCIFIGNTSPSGFGVLSFMNYSVRYLYGFVFINNNDCLIYSSDSSYIIFSQCYVSHQFISTFGRVYIDSILDNPPTSVFISKQYDDYCKTVLFPTQNDPIQKRYIFLVAVCVVVLISLLVYCLVYLKKNLASVEYELGLQRLLESDFG